MKPTPLTPADLEPLVAQVVTLTGIVNHLLDIHSPEYCSLREHGLSQETFAQMREELSVPPDLRHWLADLSRRS